MIFYSFHIGDYASATRHLSWDEDMAYRRLLDSYYMREGLLPADRKQVYRLVMASTKAQRQAVDTVLAEFFTVLQDGYFNTRCEEELNRWKVKSGNAKASAEARWRNAPDEKTQGERNANAYADAMRTQSEGNATTNHIPLTNSSPEVVRAREPLADLEVKLREAAGWQNEPAPRLAVTGPIAALIEAGADLEVDVLATVRAIAPQAGTRTSWNYFVKAIARARDDRIAASTIVSGGNGHASQPRKSNIEAVFDALRTGDEEGLGDIPAN